MIIIYKTLIAHFQYSQVFRFHIKKFFQHLDLHKVKIKSLKRVKQITTNTLHKALLDPYTKKSYKIV